MPLSNYKKIYSFSSEDPSFPASNLLSKDMKKWKCEKQGELSAYVILQLDKPHIITGIDIGNEHSAFICVLVGTNGCDERKFKEILLTSSFMTPLESRNSTTTNRVRCFTKDALVDGIANQKWELIKLICTQPFNKHVQYGLSFVKIYVSQSKDDDSVEHDKNKSVNSNSPSNASLSESPTSSLLSKFKIRKQSTDSDESNHSSLSLFKRWQQSRNGSSQNSQTFVKSPAAAIREASSPTAIAKQQTSMKPLKITPNQMNTSKQITPQNHPSDENNDDDDDDKISKPKIKSRNRMALIYDEDDEKPDEKMDKKIELDNKRRQEKTFNKKDEMSSRKFKEFLAQSETKTKNDAKDNAEPSTSRKRQSSPIQHNIDKKKFKDTDDKTSRKNPISPKLEKIVKKPTTTTSSVTSILYKPFNKLLEDVIFTISGIENPERANLKQKACDMGAKCKRDWDNTCTHLICAFMNTPKYKEAHGRGKIVTKNWIYDCHSKRMRIPWRRHALDTKESTKDESEDEILDITLKPSISKHTENQQKWKHSVTADDNSDSDRTNMNVSDNGENTEDEIEKIIEKQKEKSVDVTKKSKINDDIYEISTEEEEKCNRKENDRSHLSPVPELFIDTQFYLDSENLSSVDVIKLERFIKFYSGKLTGDASSANYLIGNVKPKSTVQTIFTGEMVKPLWIYECNDMGMKISTERYKL